MTSPRTLTDALRTALSEAWAVVHKDAINIRTVSPTRRAAIVNWLVVERDYLITNARTDEQIETLWELECEDETVEQVHVSLKAKP